MSDSKGEPTPPESPDRKGSGEQAVVPEDEQRRVLADLLARKVDELAALPEDEKRKEITATVSIFSGPLPTPEAFARYNEVQPDAADRILGMAEKEQEIRHEAQRRAVEAQRGVVEAQRGAIANDRRRIVAATIIALAVVAVAGMATWLGQASIAIPLGLAGLLGTVFRRLMARRPGPE